jgi:hypothetical protein
MGRMSKLIIRWESDSGKEYGCEEWESKSGEVYLIFIYLSNLINHLIKLGKYEQKNTRQ